MLKDWAVVHRQGTVTTADFTAHAQQYAAGPLDGLFDAWLREPTVPHHLIPRHRPAPQTCRSHRLRRRGGLARPRFIPQERPQETNRLLTDWPASLAT